MALQNCSLWNRQKNKRMEGIRSLSTKIKASRDSFIVAVKAGKATLSYDSAGYAVFICGNKRWIKKLEQGQESKGWVIEDKK